MGEHITNNERLAQTQSNPISNTSLPSPVLRQYEAARVYNSDIIVDVFVCQSLGGRSIRRAFSRRSAGALSFVPHPFEGPQSCDVGFALQKRRKRALTAYFVAQFCTGSAEVGRTEMSRNGIARVSKLLRRELTFSVEKHPPHALCLLLALVPFSISLNPAAAFSFHGSSHHQRSCSNSYCHPARTWRD